MRPKRASAAETTRSTAAGSVTSSGVVVMRSSSPATMAGASRPGLRMVAMTWLPRAAMRRAASPPNPRDAPVMSTTCSFTLASGGQDSGGRAGRRDGRQAEALLHSRA